MLQDNQLTDFVAMLRCAASLPFSVPGANARQSSYPPRARLRNATAHSSAESALLKMLFAYSAAAVGSRRPSSSSKKVRIVGASSSQPVRATLNPSLVPESTFESRDCRMAATAELLGIAEKAARSSASCCRADLASPAAKSEPKLSCSPRLDISAGTMFVARWGVRLIWVAAEAASGDTSVCAGCLLSSLPDRTQRASSKTARTPSVPANRILPARFISLVLGINEFARKDTRFVARQLYLLADWSLNC